MVKMATKRKRYKDEDVEDVEDDEDDEDIEYNEDDEYNDDAEDNEDVEISKDEKDNLTEHPKTTVKRKKYMDIDYDHENVYSSIKHYDIYN
jgi:hypothetical protein